MNFSFIPSTAARRPDSTSFRMGLTLFTAFSLGFLYFISAIPVAVAAGAPLWAATMMAWLGYSAGGVFMIALGAPVRSWFIKKMHLSLEPDSKKLFWRVWKKYGVFGMGFIAPITIGPQIAALLLLMLGESPKKILGAIALGAAPWALGFFLMIKFGVHVASSF